MEEFRATDIPHKALTESIVSLSLLTGTPFTLHQPGSFAPLLEALQEAKLGSTEVIKDSVRFTPGPQSNTPLIKVPSEWTIGEVMGILSLPMAGGIIEGKVMLSGPTHAAKRTSVSHIAEGLLPMLDRRGTRSYVETKRWGARGEALLEIRPPLAALRPANLRLPGDIVEVRALVTCNPSRAEEGKRLEDAVETHLHEEGLHFPEAECHEEPSWSETCQVLLRVEHGNIRQISETWVHAGDTPEETAARALRDLNTVAAHSNTLQAHWSAPLLLSALLSPEEPSVFPRLLPGWEPVFTRIIEGFCEKAKVKVTKDSLIIHPPEKGLIDGGCLSLDICYPRKRTDEENK